MLLLIKINDQTVKDKFIKKANNDTEKINNDKSITVEKETQEIINKNNDVGTFGDFANEKPVKKNKQKKV